MIDTLRQRANTNHPHFRTNNVFAPDEHTLSLSSALALFRTHLPEQSMQKKTPRLTEAQSTCKRTEPIQWYVEKSNQSFRELHW